MRRSTHKFQMASYEMTGRSWDKDERRYLSALAEAHALIRVANANADHSMLGMSWSGHAPLWLETWKHLGISYPGEVPSAGSIRHLQRERDPS